MATDRLYSLRELARATGVPWGTLRAAVLEGRVPAEKIGVMWVSTLDAVRTWQREGKHVPGASRKDGTFRRRRRVTR